MKIRIDHDACTGHGRCYTLSPSLFEPDDDGNGQLTRDDVPPELEDDARRAAGSCPERAITIEP
jgi:ferredoxin